MSIFGNSKRSHFAFHRNVSVEGFNILQRINIWMFAIRCTIPGKTHINSQPEALANDGERERGEKEWKPKAVLHNEGLKYACCRQKLLPLFPYITSMSKLCVHENDTAKCMAYLPALFAWDFSFFVTMCSALYFCFYFSLSTIACACARTMCFDYKLWCLRKLSSFMRHTLSFRSLARSLHTNISRDFCQRSFFNRHFDNMIAWSDTEQSLGRFLFSMPILFEQRFTAFLFFFCFSFVFLQILLSFHYFRFFVCVCCCFIFFSYSHGW